jgi:hypothetical protein
MRDAVLSAEGANSTSGESSAAAESERMNNRNNRKEEEEGEDQGREAHSIGDYAAHPQ